MFYLFFLHFSVVRYDLKLSIWLTHAWVESRSGLCNLARRHCDIYAAVVFLAFNTGRCCGSETIDYSFEPVLLQTRPTINLYASSRRISMTDGPLGRSDAWPYKALTSLSRNVWLMHCQKTRALSTMWRDDREDWMMPER